MIIINNKIMDDEINNRIFNYKLNKAFNHLIEHDLIELDESIKEQNKKNIKKFLKNNKITKEIKINKIKNVIKN